MNKRDKIALFEKLCWDVLEYIRQHPRSVTKDIFLAMLDKNPVYAVLIFAGKPNITISVSVLDRLAVANRDRAKGILSGKYGSSITQRAYLPSLIIRIKKFLAKHGEIIYGSSMFGQVHTDDMTVEDAAMWLAPRLAQMRNERDGYDKTVGMLKKSGKFKTEVAIVDSLTSLIRTNGVAKKAHEGVGLFFKR